MRAILLACFFCFIHAAIAARPSFISIDTVDYWKVYYNNQLLKLPFGDSKSVLSIALSEKNIKHRGSITVVFYNGRPCKDFITYIRVQNLKRGRALRKNGISTPFKHTFTLGELKNFVGSIIKLIWQVYDGESYAQEPKRLFEFRIK